MVKEFLPLACVRVVDVTSSPAGPYCTEVDELFASRAVARIKSDA